jgi:hypothetical protein
MVAWTSYQQGRLGPVFYPALADDQVGSFCLSENGAGQCSLVVWDFLLIWQDPMPSPFRQQLRRMRTVITFSTEPRRKLEPLRCSQELTDRWISNSGEAETFLVSSITLRTGKADE